MQTLHRHGVECVVVGGIAARLHGASHQTEDFDLVARYDVDNLRRLAAAMRELGAYIRTDGYLDEATREASKRLVHEEHLARTEITTWNSDAGQFDVLRNIPDVDGARQSYEDLAERATEATYGGIVVRLATLDDIVASKEWADRPKDHLALPELYSMQQQQRGGRDEGPAPSGSPAKPAPRPDRGRPGGRTLVNGLDHPGGAQRRPPERGIER